MILFCFLKYLKPIANIEMLMHKEHANTHSAAFSNFKPMKAAERNVNANMNSSTQLNSNLIFLFVSIFIVHLNP